MEKLIKIAFAIVAVFALFCGQIRAESNGVAKLAITDQPRFASEAGKIIWKYRAGGQIFSSPALGPDGTIYFGCLDSYFYAIKPDGTQKWRVKSENEILGSPIIDKDGMIYFSNSPGQEGKGESYIYMLSSVS